MFGKDKNAFLTTNLIVKVRKYKNEKPYFSFHDKPAIADRANAIATAEKLNELVKLEPQEKDWQTEYYSVPMTL